MKSLSCLHLKARGFYSFSTHLFAPILSVYAFIDYRLSKDLIKNLIRSNLICISSFLKGIKISFCFKKNTCSTIFTNFKYI